MTDEEFKEALKAKVKWFEDNLGAPDWYVRLSEFWEIMAEIYQFLYHDLKTKQRKEVR